MFSELHDHRYPAQEDKHTVADALFLCGSYASCCYLGHTKNPDHDDDDDDNDKVVAAVRCLIRNIRGPRKARCVPLSACFEAAALVSLLALGSTAGS